MKKIICLLFCIPYCLFFAVHTSEAQIQYLFDFGTPTSPLSPGYSQVDETTDIANGTYGWTDVTTLRSRDRATGTDLDRDFVFSDETRTFEACVDNGVWDVTLNTVDLSFNVDSMQVSAEGMVVLSNYSVPLGSNPLLNFQTTVTDGKLSLTFEDLGAGAGDAFWRINRVDLNAIKLFPDAPEIAVIDNDCEADTPGSFSIISACEAGFTLEWSTDNGTTWNTTTPAYGNNATTVIARCVDDSDNTCLSLNNPSITSSPTVCCEPESHCISQFGEFTIQKRIPIE